MKKTLIIVTFILLSIVGIYFATTRNKRPTISTGILSIDDVESRARLEAMVKLANDNHAYSNRFQVAPTQGSRFKVTLVPPYTESRDLFYDWLSTSQYSSIPKDVFDFFQTDGSLLFKNM